MSKIKIITDSGSDITQERATALGIRVIPISFTFDGETYYKEGMEMAVDAFYDKLRNSETTPKTTQVTPIEFTDVFNEEYDNGYDNLIVVTISSNGSGMNQNARMAAAEVMDERGGEITVIDSMGFSSIYGAPVIHAANMLKDGKTKDEIVAYLEDVLPTMKAYFLVDDLLHLKKGGRINSATLVIANMLDIKPVLTIKDGVVVQKDKLRGNKKVLKKLVDNAVDDDYDFNGKSILIPFSGSKERAEELKEVFNDNFENTKLFDYQLGAVIACHGGPGLTGFVFSEKYDFFDYEG
jgi:DegV family protein with EDD domain